MNVANTRRGVSDRRLDLLTDRQLSRIGATDVVLWPLGSIEPHGHLPLATDYLLPTAILERICLAIEGVWLLPTLPMGHLFKYGAWPGALAMPPDAVSATVASVCEGLARIGLRRLFVMSGHDENREPVICGLQVGRARFEVRSVYCDWLDLAVSLLPQVSESYKEGHGSEIQTSVFMYLFPDIPIELPNERVSSVKALEVGADDFFAPEECGIWVEMIEYSEVKPSFTGVVEAASAEKGQRIVDYIVRRSCVIVEELRARS